MDWIVTTARTVEEAQSRALDLLGVDSADAEIQVVEEGKTGLFGRTKTEARVRARIKPKAPPQKDERRQGRGQGDRNRNRNRGGSGGGGGGNRNRNNNRNQGQNRSNEKKDGGRNGDGKNSGNNQRSDGNKANAEQASGAKDNNSRGGSGSNNKPKGNDRQRSDNQRGDRNRSRNDRGRGKGRGAGDADDRDEMPIEEQRQTLEAFAQGVAKAFDPDATVTLVEDGNILQAQVNGDNVGALVGPKAATLAAFEELARTTLQREAGPRRYHRIQVDVDDYRARRREALANFARGIAEDVAETGRSKAMEPMGAADRKLVHDAVSEIDGVETYSEGRDPRRYIIISAIDSRDEEE